MFLFFAFFEIRLSWHLFDEILRNLIRERFIIKKIFHLCIEFLCMEPGSFGNFLKKEISLTYEWSFTKRIAWGIHNLNFS